MSKTIWVFNQFAGHPESGWGERHYYFARYWIQQGYRVVIFSGSFNHMFRNLPETHGNLTTQMVDGVEFCWVKVPTYHPQSVLRFWSMLVFAWKTLWIKTSVFGTPAAILVSSMPIFPILSALIKRSFLKDTKLVFEIRDLWPLSLQYLANISDYHPAVIFIGWFEKIGYRRADVVVSLLPNARGHIEAVAKKTINFQYIPNGIEEALLTDEALESHILEQIPEDKFIIGYTGTMALANALESFVEAAHLLKNHADIHFVLVGDGYLKAKLQELAFGLSNITFIPKIRKNQVQNILKHFDICFVSWHNSPLYQHGVSANKYFDYMLAGKPILDANNLIKDPVELSGCGIIVKPESAEAILDGILEFYDMSVEERNAMGQKGKQYLKAYHSIKKLALEYQTILEK